jgi:hypothetical protein
MQRLQGDLVVRGIAGTFITEVDQNWVTPRKRKQCADYEAGK